MLAILTRPLELREVEEGQQVTESVDSDLRTGTGTPLIEPDYTKNSKIGPVPPQLVPNPSLIKRIVPPD